MSRYLLCLLVLGCYLTGFAFGAQRPGGALSFAVLGTSNTPGNRGYDGQYYYRIAVAPQGGRHGLDRPAYRYQRIGYPFVARLLAAGVTSRIPTALVLVNILAIALGSLCVAFLLRGVGLSSLYALPYALYAGQVACFWRDLAEPLALLLVALALCIARWDSADYRRPTRTDDLHLDIGANCLPRGGSADAVARRGWALPLTALLLLAAALTKETALLFSFALALHFLLRGRMGSFLQMLVLVGVPYVLWQVWLWHIFGQSGIAGADHPPRVPLGGLVGARDLRLLCFDLLAVVLPALLCLWICVLGIRQQWRTGDAQRSALRRVFSDFPTLCLLANLLFVLWLPAPSYADLWASTRNASGLMLATLTYPALATTRFRLLLALLWVGGTPLLWLH